MILCRAWHKLLCLYLYSRFNSTLGLMLICCLCIYIPTLNKINLLTYHLLCSLTQIQPYYDHMLCLITDDNNDKSNHNTTTYCVHWRTKTTINPTMIRYDHALCLLTDDKSDNPNHNTTIYCDKSNLITTTCCVYWLTTTTNPTIIQSCIVCTDGQTQQQTKP
jgi:hypothetical protein